jgi:metallophosphoesterase (TIGR00282 family)
MAELKVLFIGDIIGGAGRKALGLILPVLRTQYQPDFIIANGENAAAGFGITKNIYDALIYDDGINVLTSGNHIWDKKEIRRDFPQLEKLIRPLNYPNCQLGAGYRIDTVKEKRICTVNLMGRVFVSYGLDCPFRAMDKFLDEMKDKADIFILDFHAEVTSEKKALGFYLDGRIGALIGTHTHIATADSILLPKGTAYITDVGMVGAKYSVLGMDAEIAINRFLYGINERFDVADQGAVEFNAVLITFDMATNKPTKIERVYREVGE